MASQRLCEKQLAVSDQFGPCICGSVDYVGHDFSKDVWDPDPPHCPFCGCRGFQADYYGHPADYFICESCGAYEVEFTHHEWQDSRRQDGVVYEGLMPDPTPRTIRVWHRLVWGPLADGDPAPKPDGSLDVVIWDYEETFCAMADN